MSLLSIMIDKIWFLLHIVLFIIVFAFTTSLMFIEGLILFKIYYIICMSYDSF